MIIKVVTNVMQIAINLREYCNVDYSFFCQTKKPM